MRKEIGGHTVFNVALSHEITDGVEIFGRIDNVLNKEYTEVLGYSSLGRAAYVGFNVTFGKN